MPILRCAAIIAWLSFSAVCGADGTLADFEAKLDRAADSGDFVGLAVAVVEDGEVAFVKTWGEREIGSGRAIGTDTAFRVASLSKGFAATLAAMLVEDGKLSWAQPVASIVPEFTLVDPAQTRAATIEHVLSHQLGLPPNAYDNLLEAGTPTEKILQRYEEVDLLCKVGECYTYQNVGFNMIVDVIEEASDRPFEDSMRDRIFEPLGFRSASIGRDQLAAEEDWARPHVRNRRGPWRTTRVRQAYYNVPAAGGINASISDMAIWLRAQLGGMPEVISPTVLGHVHSPKVTTRAETRRMRLLRGRLQSSQYGFGWRIYDYAGHKVINHSGGVEGYMAQIAFLPERGDGIVILANTRTRRAWRILPTWLDARLGLEERDWLMLSGTSATARGASAAAAR